jgi:hypothetical protein
VATFYTIDSANARLPELRRLLVVLQGQREELIRLRDQLASLEGIPGSAEGGTGALTGGSGSLDDAIDDLPSERAPARQAVVPDDEARLIQLRMQGLIDQMQASVGRIDNWGITLRDIETGLIDFPALASGRQIWLCWRLGEDGVAWYHELTTGIAGRRQLSDLT